MIIPDIPTSGLADFVTELARKYNVRYIRTEIDDLADLITHLSDDDVVTDEIEDLIVELKRTKVIDGSIMITILGNYLNEKKDVRSIQ